MRSSSTGMSVALAFTVFAAGFCACVPRSASVRGSASAGDSKAAGSVATERPQQPAGDGGGVTGSEADEQLLERSRELVTRLRERELSAHASVRGVVVTLPDGFFEFGSAQLTAEGKRRIEDLAEVVLREAPTRRIRVEGHTDSIGAELYNQGLSERRADRVAEALEADGVEESSVDRRGYGATFPIAPNSNPDGSDNPPGRARNRRVEVVILD